MSEMSTLKVGCHALSGSFHASLFWPQTRSDKSGDQKARHEVSYTRVVASLFTAFRCPGSKFSSSLYLLYSFSTFFFSHGKIKCPALFIRRRHSLKYRVPFPALFPPTQGGSDTLKYCSPIQRHISMNAGLLLNAFFLHSCDSLRRCFSFSCDSLPDW